MNYRIRKYITKNLFSSIMIVVLLLLCAVALNTFLLINAADEQLNKQLAVDETPTYTLISNSLTSFENISSEENEKLCEQDFVKACYNSASYFVTNPEYKLPTQEDIKEFLPPSLYTIEANEQKFYNEKTPTGLNPELVFSNDDYDKYFDSEENVVFVSEEAYQENGWNIGDEIELKPIKSFETQTVLEAEPLKLKIMGTYSQKYSESQLEAIVNGCKGTTSTGEKLSKEQCISLVEISNSMSMFIPFKTFEKYAVDVEKKFPTEETGTVYTGYISGESYLHNYELINNEQAVDEFELYVNNVINPAHTDSQFNIVATSDIYSSYMYSFIFDILNKITVVLCCITFLIVAIIMTVFKMKRKAEFEILEKLGLSKTKIRIQNLCEYGFLAIFSVMGGLVLSTIVFNKVISKFLFTVTAREFNVNSGVTNLILLFLIIISLLVFIGTVEFVLSIIRRKKK